VPSDRIARAKASTDNEQCQEALKCKYLCSLAFYDNGCAKDAEARMTAGHRSYQALSKIMKSIYIYISKHTKLKIYTTVIKLQCYTAVRREQ
jgi:hypothetical protein